MFHQFKRQPCRGHNWGQSFFEVVFKFSRQYLKLFLLKRNMQSTEEQSLKIRGFQECGPCRYALLKWIQTFLSYVDFMQIFTNFTQLFKIRGFLCNFCIFCVNSTGIMQSGFTIHGFFCGTKNCHKALRHKLKNSLKTQKRHFLAVLDLMLDSLTTIYVKQHQCPWHQPILLTQGPIHEIFMKKY